MQLGAIGRRKGANQFRSQNARKAPEAKELDISGISGVFKPKRAMSRKLV